MTNQTKGKNYTPLIIAVLAWFCLWSLVPALMSWSIGSWLSSDDTVSMLVDIAIAALVLMVLFLTHQKFNKQLFKAQKTRWLYVLPEIALLAIPLRVGGIDGDIFGNPAWLYVLMMTASVAMQQYLTFGLLQSYLGEKLSTPLTIMLTTLVFYLGHALFLADKFALMYPLNALFIVVLGVLFASIREKTGTLHANLALHLAFYFVLIC